MAGDLFRLSSGDLLLDRFRIDAAHSGGLGLLWTGTDQETGRRYAVKTVRPDLRDDPEVMARFAAEARTWIALGEQEFLVQAYWLIEEDPGPFLVLEFVDGTDLAELLRDGRLTLERALDLGMQCAAGIAYAHACPVDGGVGVLHRDLKPSNLMVTATDLLKVTDFGLARVLGGRVGPEEGVGVGTPAYAAPEQLRGEDQVDGRADIYSFGMILYEMLAGSNPLSSDELASQIERSLEMVPPPLEGVPPAVAALVARCIEKDPDRRPRSFDEVLAHLAVAARSLDYGGWHVDPFEVAAPVEPSGLAMGLPVLRPRRPRAGETFRIELHVSGDLGPGPVEVSWALPEVDGLEILTPERTQRTKVEAGGSARLTLAHTASADREVELQLPPTTVRVQGPEATTEHQVARLEIPVAGALVLPLVGRAAERASLVGLLQRASGGGLFFEGELGLGKTRLLDEAARLAVPLGMQVIVGRAQAASARPTSLLYELARSLLALPHGEKHGIQDAVHRVLADDSASARYFSELLGGEAYDEETPPARAWHELMVRTTRSGPLLVLLDDLQHAARGEIRLLVELSGRAQEAGLPVCVVGAYGTGEHGEPYVRRRAVFEQTLAGWERHDVLLLRRRLAPLGRKAVAELIDATFPGNGFTEEAPSFIPTIAAATGGNPFHLSELLYRLRHGDDRLAEQVDGEWHLAEDLSPERVRSLVPDALDAVVRGRLEALDDDVRAVLEYAALVGVEFDVDVIEGAVKDPQRVERAIEAMEEAEVIRPVDSEVDRYRFWSALVPPVVRRMLSEREESEVRPIHRAVVNGMLRVYHGDRRRRRALGIAEHLREAGEFVLSLPFTLAGCERLLRLQLPDRARLQLADVRSRIEEPEISDEDRAAFFYLYGVACESTGHYDEGFEALNRFVDSQAATSADPRNLPRAYARLGSIHKARGEYDRARYCLGVAAQLLEDLGDLHSVAYVLHSMAELSFEQGLWNAASGQLKSAAALAQQTHNEGAAVRVLVLRGRIELNLGRSADARVTFLEAERRGRELRDRPRRAAALLGLGEVALQRGYLSEAEKWLKEALDLNALMGDRTGLANTLIQYGAVQEGRGRVDRALRHYRRAERTFEGIGHPEGVAWARLHSGRLLRRWARTTHAVRDLASAAEGFQRLETPERFAALRELGYALADAGAEHAARIALARADRGQPAGTLRRSHRAIAAAVRSRLALAMGDVDRAQSLARRALRQAARTTGHEARLTAQIQASEVALRVGDLKEARDRAETALAFAREEGSRLAAAAAERILMELAARAGRLEEVSERAHRAARAYTGRADAGAGPALLLDSLARGLRETAPHRASRYARAARRCFDRLAEDGFKVPQTGEVGRVAGGPV